MATASKLVIEDRDVILGFALGRVSQYPEECGAMARLIDGLATDGDRHLLTAFIEQHDSDHGYPITCDALGRVLRGA